MGGRLCVWTNRKASVFTPRPAHCPAATREVTPEKELKSTHAASSRLVTLQGSFGFFGIYADDKEFVPIWICPDLVEVEVACLALLYYAEFY